MIYNLNYVIFFMNYYEILNIQYNSTQKQIKKAYHKLCLQWHPDKNKNPKACEKFKEIAKAYETLSNEKLKKAYDCKLDRDIKFKKKETLFVKLFENLKKLNKQNIGDYFRKGLQKIKSKLNNQDILRYITKIDEYYKEINLKSNKNKEENYCQKSPVTNYKLYISLEDYYNNKENQFKIPVLTKCYLCSKNYNNLCKICNGTVFYVSIRLITLKLNKYKYNIQKLGNHGFGFEEPGDLCVFLEDKKHNDFTRTGNFNLVYVETIDLTTIKNEYTIVFTFLDNKQYTLTIPNFNFSKDNKFMIEIKKFGLPDYCGNFGKLFILFKNKLNKQKKITCSTFKPIEINDFKVISI